MKFSAILMTLVGLAVAAEATVVIGSDCNNAGQLACSKNRKFQVSTYGSQHRLEHTHIIYRSSAMATNGSRMRRAMVLSAPVDIASPLS